jgi:hypothetical protein
MEDVLEVHSPLPNGEREQTADAARASVTNV